MASRMRFSLKQVTPLHRPARRWTRRLPASTLEWPEYAQVKAVLSAMN